MLAVIMGLYALLDEPLVAFLIARLEAEGQAPAWAVTLPMGLLLGGFAGFALAERLAEEVKAQRLLPPTAGAMALALPATLFGPPLVVVLGGFAFGLGGAIFYTALQGVVLTLRPGQAGSTSAVVSAVGLAGAAFPGLVGAVSDAHGLAAGLLLYAAVPALILGLTAALRLRGA